MVSPAHDGRGGTAAGEAAAHLACEQHGELVSEGGLKADSILWSGVAHEGVCRRCRRCQRQAAHHLLVRCRSDVAHQPHLHAQEAAQGACRVVPFISSRPRPVPHRDLPARHQLLGQSSSPSASQPQYKARACSVRKSVRWSAAGYLSALLTINCPPQDSAFTVWAGCPQAVLER